MNNLSQLSSLEDWLSYIEKIHPVTIDLGLERIKKVTQSLALLPFNFPVITVAGTNGKGSCVALTSTILQQGGYRVGAYFSPHLLHFNERVQLEGKPVNDTLLIEAFKKIEVTRKNITLTYFEYITLAALIIFKEAAIEVAVLEVGLGGRLDAVNIVDPSISIISTIALDHMEWLGKTRAQIGFEKAGIMRMKTPCVYGDYQLPTTIAEQSLVLEAPLFCQAKDFGFMRGENLNLMSVNHWKFWNNEEVMENLPLPAIHLQNAACVLQALSLLKNKLPLSQTAIREGLARVFIPGRFQYIESECTSIVDVAHNPASAALLARQLADSSVKGKTIAVVGMLADKDIHSTLAVLIEQIECWYIGSLHGARGASAEKLAKELAILSARNVLLFSSVEEAYRNACQESKAEDRIIVFGSFYTVAEVLKSLEKGKKIKEEMQA